MVSHDHISSAHICTVTRWKCLYFRLMWEPYLLSWNDTNLPSESVTGLTQKFPPSGENPCWVVFSLLMLTASCLMLEIKRFRYCRNFRVNDGTYWVAARCVTEAFSTTCAVHIEDCECRLLFGCHGAVAENWQLNPEVVSWVGLLATAGLFILAS